MNSKLLEEAIIDAEALRESALKNAEQAILEKYAPEVKLAIESLLEQEPAMAEDPAMDMGMDMGMGTTGPEQKEMDVSYAAMDGMKLCPCPDDGEKMLISVEDLRTEMEKMVMDLARSNDAGEEEMPSEEDMGEPMDQEISPEDQNMEEPMDQEMSPEEEEEEEELPEEPLAEEIEIDENLLLSLLSEEEDSEDEDSKDDDSDEAKIERGADINNNGEIEGWEAARDEKIQQSKAKNESKSSNKEKLLVEKKNKLLTEAVSEIKKEYEKFLKEHKRLLEEKQNANNVVQQLSQRLEESNLMNAKLLYKNQALGSDSLNERQKNKIVEAVSKAGSVDEAKMIYETLCNAVGSFDNKGPQSLSEAVEKKGGLSLKPRQQTNSSPNPLKNRWQKIAGIKK